MNPRTQDELARGLQSGAIRRAASLCISRALALAALGLLGPAGQARASNAQRPVWRPSPGHRQIPIWPGAAPVELHAYAQGAELVETSLRTIGMLSE
jgi:hypothetical protein